MLVRRIKVRSAAEYRWWRCPHSVFSLLPLEGGGAKRRRLACFFAIGNIRAANPASLREAAPSKGRGSCGHSLLPMEGGAPKGRRLAGDSGIFETKPSPLGEGARKGRIERWRYEREWGNAFQAGDMRQYPSSDFCKRRCPKAVFKSQITRGS